MTLQIILSVITILALAILTFTSCAPQFGGKVSKAQKQEFEKLDNFTEGKFTNQSESLMDISFFKMIKEMTKKVPNKKPNQNVLVNEIDSLSIVNHNQDSTRLTWFGHSTFLVEIDGKKILIDPMFGEVPAPHPMLGAKRFSENLPIEIEQLPFIDAVIYSHDHYDHLDYGSIQKLKHKVGQFFTPLGLGNHLVKWGVEQHKITELNWWESVVFENINLVCTPARHFSGRGLFDRANTLWCSWVIQGKNDNIFFSGDSGYDTHFKEIGKKYGPFDISLMECGQYNDNWKLIHMSPEETVQAAIDVKSKLTLPIHWGGFTLAFHEWTEPVERFLKKANAEKVLVTTPKIGEQIIINSPNFPKEKWWERYR